MSKTPPSVAEMVSDRTSETPPAASPDGELNLLLSWPDEGRSFRWRTCFALSVALHVVLFTGGLRLRTLVPGRLAPQAATRTRVTPLYVPRDLLTQRAPNRGKISKTFDLADLMAARQIQRRLIAPAPGKTRRLELPKQSTEPAPKAIAPQISAEPAQVAASQVPPAGVPDSIINRLPPAPAPAPDSLPSLGAEQPAKVPARLVPPKNSVQDVIQQMAKRDSGSSSVVVIDNGPSPALPAAPGQNLAPPRMGSALELKSDPQGADFKPYLTRILAIVRRNWFSVLPDSARMGILRGRTTVQFIVNRDGSIPKLVIADSSGLQPLDRAAIAGLSMSNPLPPLPADFKGGLIRLQFSFNYNVPSL
jgi:protein TonB